MDADDLRPIIAELEVNSPMPDVPTVMGTPSEITRLQQHYEDSEAGRVRNARIALVLAAATLLLTLALGVALGGWFSTSRALETRNRAVLELTNQGILAAKIDVCQDQALAEAFDQAIVLDDYREDRLGTWYDTCLLTGGERFR